MSHKKAEDEKRHNRVVEAILTVLAMFGARGNAVKGRTKSELEEEMEHKEREEQSKSDLEREQEMAK